MPDLKTVDLEGVEIARTGEWMGGGPGGRPVLVKLTRDDFDAAVEAARKVGRKLGQEAVEVPVKLGHQMRQAIFGDLADDLADGEPAFGWVTNLRRVGDTLVADVKRVPARLADLLKAGAWRRRSIEFGRNWQMAGERHPFFVTAVSLLGTAAPAVEGLADLYAASAPDAGDLFVVTCAKGDDAGELTEAELERALTKLAALVDELEPYFRGRPGAPMARMMFQGWQKQLRQAARYRPTEARMGDAPDDGAEAFGLALNGDAAIAVLAEILQMPGATADDVIAKVRELTGGDPAASEDPAAGGGEPMEGGMSKVTPDARIAGLERQIADAKAEAAKALVMLARRDAEAKADRDIAAHSLPAAIRETLVTLAARGDDALYDSVVGTSQRVPTGERGTSGGTDAAAIEPTDAELAAFLSAGISRAEAVTTLRAYKAQTLGIAPTNSEV